MAAPKPTPAPKPGGLVFNEASHRYRLDGRPVRGVTGLIGAGIPKDNLIPWAAECAAKLYLADDANLAELARLDPDEFTKRMKWAHKDVRDAAGVTGTRVHDLAEQLHATGECDADDDVASYVEGYVQFLDEWQITPHLMERPVGNRQHWYAGKFDLFATSPLLSGGELVQIDLKTSKGVYGETALQTAAYAKAEFFIDQDGREHPLPKVHATYVAHVTPLDRDGEHARYEGRPLGTSLYPLAETPEQIEEHFNWFLAAAYTAKTTAERAKLATEPLPLPTATGKAA
jgi:hypothetical protein